MIGQAQPQRYIKGRGWIECQPHQAGSWAAFLGNRLLGRYGNQSLALEAIRVTKLNKLGPKRHYQLGGRMEQRTGDAPLYTSLTKEQYEKGAEK